MNGADIDAVAAIQHAGNQAAGVPTCDLWVDAAGFLRLRVGDPDGLTDLDLDSFRVSLKLVEVPRERLFSFMQLASVSTTDWELVSKEPLSNYDVQNLLAVSIRDQSGAFSGDQIAVHP